ncbi:hypothetical protein SB659_07675 [Arthrobacter sp. SIMBA_036]|uniref:hypothetical protein n=1 Tax=Arthrobacter sp. SIMBA_036 TaxID=3085778 RepID=UPI00397B29D1
MNTPGNIVSILDWTPKAPKGFTVPMVDPLFPDEVPLYFDGPSRETGTELGPVQSAYSATQGGFTVTIGSVELPLDVARRVSAIIAGVVEEVEHAKAEYERKAVE